MVFFFVLFFLLKKEFFFCVDFFKGKHEKIFISFLSFSLSFSLNKKKTTTFLAFVFQHVVKDVFKRAEGNHMDFLLKPPKILENQKVTTQPKNEKLLAVYREGIVGNYEPPEKETVRKPGENT